MEVDKSALTDQMTVEDMRSPAVIHHALSPTTIPSTFTIFPATRAFPLALPINRPALIDPMAPERTVLRNQNIPELS